MKVVGEFICIFFVYYDNNIVGIVSFLKVMEENNCKNIIFSFFVIVYGDFYIVLILEDFLFLVINLYGCIKFMLEEILIDIYKVDLEWNVVLFCYFNLIGVYESGDLGENLNGILNNFLLYVI